MRYAKCVSHFRPSPIRGMMKAVANPDVISFAGGMPGAELFPVEDIKEIIAEMPVETMNTALQYGPTDGQPIFVDLLTKEMERRGFDMTKNKIIVTTGSTQVMSIISKLLIDPDDVMLTEDPVFVGSAGAFCSFQVKIESVGVDAEGIIISELKEALKHNPKFIYITPSFHNPAGLTYSRARREEFLATMAEYPEVMILEDDAYGQLYYDEEIRTDIVPMKTYAKNEGQIIYCSSFSKIFGPGLRIGWMVIPNEMFEVAEICKQSIDACTPPFSQMLGYEFMKSGRQERYCTMLREVYKLRRDKMVECLGKYCPEMTFVIPRGGFFLWAKLPEGVNMDTYFNACAARGVVFVKGDAFSPSYADNGHIRISFSNTDLDIIERGVKMMGEELKKLL